VGAGEASDDGYVVLARQTLALGMCPRRSTDERRRYLAGRLDESRPSSVIYARQSFCDPGAYDAVLVAQLAQERGLPYLEIEVGFPFEATGPLRTRVEAFLEAQLLDEDLLDDLLDEDE
jgi:benzoyl-CoA reductase/2-hydroxyglutaryl-CoA dehydratase subunit BcrC/BadD/HgdB